MLWKGGVRLEIDTQIPLVGSFKPKVASYTEQTEAMDELLATFAYTSTVTFSTASSELRGHERFLAMHIERCGPTRSAVAKTMVAPRTPCTAGVAQASADNPEAIPPQQHN